MKTAKDWTRRAPRLALLACLVGGAGLGAGGCGSAGGGANASADTPEARLRSELLASAGADADYAALVAQLQQAGLSVDAEAAAYERHDEPATDPETGHVVPFVDRLATPVLDGSGRHVAVLVYSVSGGEAAVALRAAEGDAEGAKLGEVTAALEAAEPIGRSESALSAAAAPCPYCAPWECRFWSRRTWTIACLTRAAGGWARVPAWVGGYSCYPDHRDVSQYVDYEGRIIACPSHDTGKKEGYRVCCPSLPCTGR